tara:strand:+ start:804 stop:989 length:186 start_codon:yes stop_codon:yes gene_type:complete
MKTKLVEFTFCLELPNDADQWSMKYAGTTAALDAADELGAPCGRDDISVSIATLTDLEPTR